RRRNQLHAAWRPLLAALGSWKPSPICLGQIIPLAKINKRATGLFPWWHGPIVGPSERGTGPLQEFGLFRRGGGPENPLASGEPAEPLDDFAMPQSILQRLEGPILRCTAVLAGPFPEQLHGAVLILERLAVHEGQKEEHSAIEGRCPIEAASH